MASQTQRALTKTLDFDDLEARLLLAGNVNVFFTGDVLNVIGNAADNGVQINAIDDDQIVITGTGGTSINGGPADGSIIVDGDDLEGLRVRLAGGNDVLEIQNASGDELEIDGLLDIRGGTGGDTISIGEGGVVEAESIEVLGLLGADTLSFGPGVDIDEGSSNIRGGAQADIISFLGGSYDTGLFVAGGGGGDTISALGTTVKDAQAVFLGNGGADDLSGIVPALNDFEEGSTIIA